MSVTFTSYSSSWTSICTRLSAKICSVTSTNATSSTKLPRPYIISTLLNSFTEISSLPIFWSIRTASPKFAILGSSGQLRTRTSFLLFSLTILPPDGTAPLKFSWVQKSTQKLLMFGVSGAWLEKSSEENPYFLDIPLWTKFKEFFNGLVPRLSKT